MTAAVSRERQVVEAFVALTSTLVVDFDVLDLMTTLAERTKDLLDISAVGVVLRTDQGRLAVAGTSSGGSRLLEVLVVAIHAGPAVDCARTGEPVTCEDLHAGPGRWPRFAVGATAAGLQAVHALPMRLRGKVVGVLVLLHTAPHVLTADDRRLGQALADAATVALLSDRAVRDAETVTAQLQGAFDTRIIIEQAKGVLVGQGHGGPDNAFVALRSYVRAHSLRLRDVARDIVTGTLDLPTVLGSPPSGSGRRRMAPAPSPTAEGRPAGHQQ